MQARPDRAHGRPHGRGRFGRRQTDVMDQHDHCPALDAEPLERVVELVLDGDAGRSVRDDRLIGRQQPEVAAATSFPAYMPSRVGPRNCGQSLASAPLVSSATKVTNVTNSPIFRSLMRAMIFGHSRPIKANSCRRVGASPDLTLQSNVHVDGERPHRSRRDEGPVEAERH